MKFGVEFHRTSIEQHSTSILRGRIRFDDVESMLEMAPQESALGSLATPATPCATPRKMDRFLTRRTPSA